MAKFYRIIVLVAVRQLIATNQVTRRIFYYLSGKLRVGEMLMNSTFNGIFAMDSLLRMDTGQRI